MELMNILKILFRRTISFLVFLIILLFMNLLIPLVNLQLFSAIVWFLNNSLLVLLMSTLFLLFGDLFLELLFPINLPAPILFAVGGIFITSFILSTLEFILGLFGLLPDPRIRLFYSTIYLVVFIIILIVGYVGLIKNRSEGGFFKRSHAFGKAQKRRGASRKPRGLSSPRNKRRRD